MLWAQDGGALGEECFSRRIKLGDVNKLVTYTDKHITSPPPSSPRAWMGATPGPLCPQPPAHVGKPNHFILFCFEESLQHDWHRNEAWALFCFC